MITRNGRTADYPVADLFLDRWSPRSFTGEAMPDAELFTLFEAARWAPSSSNLQPWRFLYAKRDTPNWSLFFEPLNDGNKGWVVTSSVLVAVLSRRTAPVRGSDTVRESYTHSFDTGAAWACLALQAALNGWAAHAMGGFDMARAVAALSVPDDHRLECLVAVGRFKEPQPPAVPNGRTSQAGFVREGVFRG